MFAGQRKPGLSTFVTQDASRYILAYCRAVLNRPPLVLADEPTGNLDDEHARVILAELRASTAERGAAVVLVTHRPEAQAGADRVLRLRDGRLV